MWAADGEKLDEAKRCLRRAMDEMDRACDVLAGITEGSRVGLLLQLIRREQRHVEDVLLGIGLAEMEKLARGAR